jgi:GT2 family glycosyltransferase
MSQSIICVVVTYNRLSLLKECISALRNQTYKLDKILVVNNDSNDGTTEWLNIQQDLEVIHQGNLGGAGGFYTGIKEAVKQNYDYIWVMDDDVEPELDCLYHLVEAFKAKGDYYDILMPDRFYDLERKQNWHYGTALNFTNPFKDLAKGDGVVASNRNSGEILEIVAFPFEGPMFKREVIVTIGEVEKDFFIIHDDTDYSVRAIKAGFKIGVVTAALLPKKIPLIRNSPRKVDFKLYYTVRNNIILDRKFGSIFFALVRNGVLSLKLIGSFTMSAIKSRNIPLLKAYKEVYRGMYDGFKWKLK